MKPRIPNSAIELRWFLGVVLLFFPQARACAQSVVATVPVGRPSARMSVNPITNKIYVAVCASFSEGVRDQ